MPKGFGALFAEIRREYGKTQADVLEKARIDAETLSRLENDRGNPRLETALAAAKALEDLTGRNPLREFVSADLIERLRAGNGLSQASQDTRESPGDMRGVRNPSHERYSVAAPHTSKHAPLTPGGAPLSDREQAILDDLWSAYLRIRKFGPEVQDRFLQAVDDLAAEFKRDPRRRDPASGE